MRPKEFGAADKKSSSSKIPFEDRSGNLSIIGGSIFGQLSESVVYKVERKKPDLDFALFTGLKFFKQERPTVSALAGVQHANILEISPATPVKGVIAALRSSDAAQRSAELAESLVQLGSDGRFHDEVFNELPAIAMELVTQKQPGAVAALEACGRLGVDESYPAFRHALLSGNPGSVTTQVASQRVRLLPRSGGAAATELGERLRILITEWLQHGPEEAARVALLSASWADGENALGWLADVINRHPSARIVNAAAQSANAYARARAVSHAVPLNEDQERIRQILLQSACARFEPERLEGETLHSDLARARLLETVGAFWKWGDNKGLCHLLASRFLEGSALERSAVVDALRNAVDTVGAEVFEEMRNAFVPENLPAFLHLLRLGFWRAR